MLRARQMRQTITLLADQGTASATGHIVPNFQLQDTVRAAVAPVKSDAARRDSEDQIDQVLEFRIRWRSDITAAWRIGFNGGVYEIQGAPTDPDYRQWELVIHGRLLQV